jgi:hypothetical protein
MAFMPPLLKKQVHPRHILSTMPLSTTLSGCSSRCAKRASSPAPHVEEIGDKQIRLSLAQAKTDQEMTDRLIADPARLISQAPELPKMGMQLLKAQGYHRQVDRWWQVGHRIWVGVWAHLISLRVSPFKTRIHLR